MKTPAWFRAVAVTWTVLMGLSLALILPHLRTDGVGHQLTTACEQEGGGPVIPCRWDSRTMGNRQGTEVYLIIQADPGYRVLWEGK
jgi:hypothetical protein